MHKLMLAGVLALALGACAQLQTAFDIATGQVVTPQMVVVAINTFDAIEVTATNYLRLPLCPAAALCRTAGASASVVTWIRAARSDRNQLRAALAANPNQNLTLLAVYQDLQATTSQIASVVQAH